MSCRFVQLGGRPAFFGAGSSGSSAAHCPSVRSCRLVTGYSGHEVSAQMGSLGRKLIYRRPYYLLVSDTATTIQLDIHSQTGKSGSIRIFKHCGSADVARTA
jgi:hypothetical protein